MITIDKEKDSNDSDHANENLETDKIIPYLEMTHNGLSARIMFSISNVGVCHRF